MPFFSPQRYFLSTVLFSLPLWPHVAICHSLDVFSFITVFSPGVPPADASCLAHHRPSSADSLGSESRCLVTPSGSELRELVGKITQSHA